MQTEKSQPRITDNAGNSVFRFRHYPLTQRVGIFRSASETDVWLHLCIILTYGIKDYSKSFVISFIYGILRRITAFYKRHSMFFLVVHKWCNFRNCPFWHHFKRRVWTVSAHYKTEFSSTAKNRTNSVSKVGTDSSINVYSNVSTVFGRSVCTIKRKIGS